MRWAIAKPLVFASLVLAAVACSRGATPEDDVQPRSETALRVENQSFLDMTIYVVRSGVRTRIGVAPGLSTRVFLLAPHVVGAGTDLQFLADPIGGSRTPISERIFVNPGDVIELRIPAQP